MSFWSAIADFFKSIFSSKDPRTEDEKIERQKLEEAGKALRKRTKLHKKETKIYHEIIKALKAIIKDIKKNKRSKKDLRGLIARIETCEAHIKADSEIEKIKEQFLELKKIHDAEFMPLLKELENSFGDDIKKEIEFIDKEFKKLGKVELKEEQEAKTEEENLKAAEGEATREE